MTKVENINKKSELIIDCISDLHGFYPKLEGGDLLIVAGDLTARGEYHEYIKFCSWMEHCDYEEKIVVAGNHDNALVPGKEIKYGFDFSGWATYLCDSGTEFEGLKIWGSPWTTTFEGMNPHCKAFTVDTEEELAAKWALIPNDIDILVTHSPAYGILDKCFNGNVGSKSLLKCIEKVVPEIVLFGHIHEFGGKSIEKKGILYINGSLVDERYRNINTRRRVIFDEKMPKMQRFKIVE